MEKGKVSARYHNTDHTKGGRTELEDHLADQMHFDRMSTFKQKLIFGFGEDLNGVRLGAVSLFESEETKDIEAYNRWNFTSPELWDSTSTGF